MSSSPSLSKHIPLRYRFTSVTRHAYGRGVNQPQQVTLLAAAKSIGGMHRYAVANEIVAAEIGRFLRLPVPLTGIARPETSTHAPSWLVSLDFNDTGTTLPELDRRRANAAVAAFANCGEKGVDVCRRAIQAVVDEYLN